MNAITATAGTQTAARYQTLSTIVGDQDLGLDVMFVVFPFAAPGEKSRPEALPGDELELIPPLVRITQVERDLEWQRAPESLKSETDLYEAMQRVLVFAGAEPLRRGKLDEFSLFLIWEHLVPFRQSPISGASLVDLLAKGSGPGAGGLLGMLAGDQSWLLFLTVPGGMIIGGAAYGVASALQEGLHERVLAWIRREKE
jgi:hypothetical protein